MECAPRLPGCGTQHPHRALGGTRVLLAAAPTTPPCFRRWRRSSLLQRKNDFKFAPRENLRIFPGDFFTGGGVKANGICSACFLRKQSRCGQAFCCFQRTTLSGSLRSPAPPKGELLPSFGQHEQSSPFGGAGTPSGVTERVRFHRKALRGSLFSPTQKGCCTVCAAALLLFSDYLLCLPSQVHRSSPVISSLHSRLKKYSQLK